MGAFATDVLDDVSLFHEEKVACGTKKNKVGKNKTAAAASQYQLSE